MHDRLHRRTARDLLLSIILVLAGATGTLGRAEQASSSEAASDRRIETALERLNIPEALSAYDARTAALGPSREWLARIGRGNLRYSLEEGDLWARFEAARVLSSLEDAAGQQALLEYLDSPQQVFRVRALQEVAKQGLRQATARARAIMEDGSRLAHERIAAALALHRLGEPDAARRALVTLAETGQDRDRAQAVGALATVASPEERDALAARLEDPFFIALRAAEGLARIGDSRGIDFLVASLSREDTRQTVAVLAAMAAAGVSGGGETIRSMLDELLPEYSEPKADKLDVLIYLYSWIDLKSAYPYLERMLKVEDWPHGRYLAARRLAELGEERALPILAAVYHSEPARKLPAYRQNAVQAAGWLGDRAEVRDLAAEALEDVDRHVRQAAIDLLSGLGDPRCLPTARSVLGGAALLQRVLVTESLERFGSGPPSPPGGPTEAD